MEKFMKSAIREAKKCVPLGEVPIGCVIVIDGKIIARGHNLRQKTQNAIKHAEIIAIEKACKKLNSWRLIDAELYVTLEPCPMCAGAILNSRIKKVVFGGYDEKFGAVKTCYELLSDKRFNHSCEVFGGVLESECVTLLKSFFLNRRQENKEKKLNARCENAD